MTAAPSASAGNPGRASCRVHVGEGVEPALADVDLRPCAARDRHVDCLPTIIADDGDDELLRCRGHPTEEATERITELCG